MGFNCGIIGLPNVGKSTIFNALTRAKADSANYPFCTIDPNVGIVNVPDDRLDFIAEHIKPKKVTPTTIEFVDIAGLVKGASKGEGLGNQFLSNIRQVDAVAHVVRCFEDENIVHVNGRVDPKNDIEIINTELLLADLEVLERAIVKVEKNAKSGNKELKEKAKVLKDIYNRASLGVMLKNIVNEDEKELLKEYNLLTLKPMMYVLNVDEEGLYEDNDYVKAVKEIAEKENARVVKICGKIEAELTELDEEEAKQFLKEMGLERSGLEYMIMEGYKLLSLITFFTAGEKEVKAWTIKEGTPAVKAAGKIHSDIERGFIRAEVVDFETFKEYKSMQKIKELGKLRLEGKEYIVKDGDIIYFRFNV
ncbi:redox-regulated ATPase YchF [Deferribacter autotrophicus]|uniref:Ribosome-binding ATPase YchF n=1 Tax=Deferribacter autotrophicus TaxID=500465 RepID=A0A5A8F7Y7_9BACT|nr:redox-regulated ATPase YchF [Deferribacter autotrophicus]KAA0258382.1 redox-regulated ATPase YchF [Deferribacter autotrophicus]